MYICIHNTKPMFWKHISICCCRQALLGHESSFTWNMCVAKNDILNSVRLAICGVYIDAYQIIYAYKS